MRQKAGGGGGGGGALRGGGEAGRCEKWMAGFTCSEETVGDGLHGLLSATTVDFFGRGDGLHQLRRGRIRI